MGERMWRAGVAGVVLCCLTCVPARAGLFFATASSMVPQEHRPGIAGLTVPPLCEPLPFAPVAPTRVSELRDARGNSRLAVYGASGYLPGALAPASGLSPSALDAPRHVEPHTWFFARAQFVPFQHPGVEVPLVPPRLHLTLLGNVAYSVGVNDGRPSGIRPSDFGFGVRVAAPHDLAPQPSSLIPFTLGIAGWLGYARQRGAQRAAANGGRRAPIVGSPG
jgi:hypothetical protein